VRCRGSGSRRVLVELQGHGREEIFEGVDLSRTVGWFTTMYPVDLAAPGPDWGTALKSVKERLRSVPGRGLGFGALRYLRRSGGAQAAPVFGGAEHPPRLPERLDRPRPQSGFNYLGSVE